MFGSNVLEIASGLIFVYLLLSMLCTTINEQVIARVLGLRARTLESGIKNMFSQPSYDVQSVPQFQKDVVDKLVSQIYNYPLVKGLSQNAASNKARKPSYIPAELFAVAVMGTEVVKTYKADMLKADVVNSMPSGLALIIQQADDDIVKELAGIEKWFNDSMERVSGWYKRRVQLIIFLLGLVIVAGLNIDTLSLITSLSNDSVLRSTVIAAAQGPAATPANTNLTTLMSNIQQIQPTLGWSMKALPGDFWGWVLKIVGLLATTFAISLGSPFWFDVLNKFIAFRSSGPPPQPSPGSAGPTIPTRKLVVETAPSPGSIASPLVSSSNVVSQTDTNNGAA